MTPELEKILAAIERLGNGNASTIAIAAAVVIGLICWAAVRYLVRRMEQAEIAHREANAALVNALTAQNQRMIEVIERNTTVIQKHLDTKKRTNSVLAKLEKAANDLLRRPPRDG